MIRLKGWEHLRFWDMPWFSMAEHTGFWKQDSLDGKVFPRYENWFRALELTPYDKVRCVILGQDPYPTKGHANGLAFSVYPHVRPLPASLRNIFAEYRSDLGYPTPKTGDLTSWAESGVLLLNSILTVEEGKPLSHAGLGWEKLSHEIVRSLGERGDVVFILWGKKAQEYIGACINCPVLSAAHPSPYSAATGFFGSKPFSKSNLALEKLGREIVNWKLI